MADIVGVSPIAEELPEKRSAMARVHRQMAPKPVRRTSAKWQRVWVRVRTWGLAMRVSRSFKEHDAICRPSSKWHGPAWSTAARRCRPPVLFPTFHCLAGSMRAARSVAFTDHRSGTPAFSVERFPGDPRVSGTTVRPRVPWVNLGCSSSRSRIEPPKH